MFDIVVVGSVAAAAVLNDLVCCPYYQGHEIQKPVDIYNLLASQTSSDESATKFKVPPNDQSFMPENYGARHSNRLPSAKVFNVAIPKKVLQKYFSVDDIWRLGRMWKKILYK